MVPDSSCSIIAMYCFFDIAFSYYNAKIHKKVPGQGYRSKIRV